MAARHQHFPCGHFLGSGRAHGLRVYSDPRDTTWVNVTAFGKVADDLARHSKGEMLSVIGRAQLNRYRPQDGAARDDLGVVADSLMSARTSRPSGKRTTSSAPSASPPAAEPEFDDDIP